jgi:2-dehydropantoate 2-reductase
MKICILGAGSLGSAIGGKLAEGGNDVVLIARNAAHIKAVNTTGLIMRTGGVDRTVRLSARADTVGLGPVDLVVVLVKSFDTRGVMEAARNIVGPNTTVMSLQNGLGHEDILGDIVGRDKVIAGKCYVGGQLIGPGHVIAGTVGKETIIGELDRPTSARVRAIADTFDRAGLQVVVSPDIMRAMWDKLLVNVATGALCAITRLSYGELYQAPEVEAAAVAAVTEGMAVAAAKGVKISFTHAIDPWLKAGAGLPYEFKASMLQSLDAGRPTEVDFINGAVVRAGAEAGIPTPVNATLVACIKGIERDRVAALQKRKA